VAESTKLLPEHNVVGPLICAFGNGLIVSVKAVLVLLTQLVTGSKPSAYQVPAPVGVKVLPVAIGAPPVWVLNHLTSKGAAMVATKSMMFSLAQMLYPVPVGVGTVGQLQLGDDIGNVTGHPLSAVMTMFVPVGILVMVLPLIVPVGVTLMVPPVLVNITVYVISDGSHIADTNVKIGVAVIVTVVIHVAILPQVFVVVQVMVDTPGLNIPLASGPFPLLVVAPVMEKLKLITPPQLLEADAPLILYTPEVFSQNETSLGQTKLITGSWMVYT
jgi:hypothetical protein